MPTTSANFYNQNAKQLAGMYLSKTFEQVHESWFSYLSPILNIPSARILDLGAGAGRDSKYLAQKGAVNNVTVTAIEPAFTLAEIGKHQTKGLNVNWLQDFLPDLSVVTKQEINFDLILLSAVWMHIPNSQRECSLYKLTNLLKPSGKLVISLRYGESGDAREMHDVCSEQVTTLANKLGLSTLLVTDENQDVIGRDTVTWQTVVLLKGTEA